MAILGFIVVPVLLCLLIYRWFAKLRVGTDELEITTPFGSSTLKMSLLKYFKIKWIYGPAGMTRNPK